MKRKAVNDNKINRYTGLAENLQKFRNLAASILIPTPYDCNVYDVFRVLGLRNLTHQKQDQKATIVQKNLVHVWDDSLFA